MHTPGKQALDLNRLLQALLTEQHLDASDTLLVLEQAAARPACGARKWRSPAA